MIATRYALPSPPRVQPLYSKALRSRRTFLPFFFRLRYHALFYYAGVCHAIGFVTIFFAEFRHCFHIIAIFTLRLSIASCLPLFRRSLFSMASPTPRHDTDTAAPLLPDIDRFSLFIY